MAALTDSIVIAAGGILTAIITGAFAFGGIVYNAKGQRRPRIVKLDPAELDRLRTELDIERKLRHLAELDATRWRDAALAALSRPDPSDRPE